MDRNEFIEELNLRGYSYEIVGESIVVTHNWRVTLYVKKIPKGVVFDSGSNVYLSYLTELPEGTVFKNRGFVALHSLTKLPKGTKFYNKGGVFIGSLKEMDEDDTFHNKGVVLLSLEKLPEGMEFCNRGMIYMDYLVGRHFYLGEERLFENADGFTMLIEHQKVTNGYTIKTARYFGGGPIEELDKCYIAEKYGVTSHGSTVKEAIEDLEFKLIENTKSKEVVKEIHKSGRVTLDQFRHITGACREGVRHHLAGLDIMLDDITDMALDEALGAMEGTAFGETFKKTLTGA